MNDKSTAQALAADTNLLNRLMCMSLIAVGARVLTKKGEGGVVTEILAFGEYLIKFDSGQEAVYHEVSWCDADGEEDHQHDIVFVKPKDA